MKNSKVADINKVLFNKDPMNIGTVENNLIDEYMSLSEAIAEKISEDSQLEEAIRDAFEYSFWVDCLEKEVIQSIAIEIKSAS